MQINLTSKNTSQSLIGFLGVILLSSCATTLKGKALEHMALGASMGGVYGVTRNHYQNQNALLFGALGGVIGALVGLYRNDPDQKVFELQTANNQLKADLDRFQHPQVLLESPATFNAKIPAKYRKLINPGQWKISEIDQWIEESENRLIHQDLVMELIPPSLNPNQNLQPKSK